MMVNLHAAMPQMEIAQICQLFLACQMQKVALAWWRFLEAVVIYMHLL